MKVFLVGGAVRDLLLGQKPKDRDFVVVGSTKEEMLSLGFQEVGNDFPVFLHKETKEEYALARTERKNGNGYQGFSVSFDQNVTLEDDLIRRDLTINSMAMDLTTGELFDPFNGKKDLEDKVLRATSVAFKDDPVRVLRLCRFAAKFNFEIHPDTKALVKELKDAGELKFLTKERIKLEIDKALSGDNSWIFFEKLVELDVWSDILPMLKIDDFDLFCKVIKTLKQSNSDLTVLWSAINFFNKNSSFQARSLVLSVEEEKGGTWLKKFMNQFDQIDEMNSEAFLELLSKSRMLREEDLSESILMVFRAFSAHSVIDWTDEKQSKLLTALIALGDMDLKKIAESCKQKEIADKIKMARLDVLNSTLIKS